jgi:hypothetical protein
MVWFRLGSWMSGSAHAGSRKAASLKEQGVQAPHPSRLATSAYQVSPDPFSSSKCMLVHVSILKEEMSYSGHEPIGQHAS